MADSFTFGDQSDVMSYKQLGNGVAVGAVYQVVKAAIERDAEILKVTNPTLLKTVKKAPQSPVKTKSAIKKPRVSEIS
jgi:DNA (cytosine-5)-methyltransferase 1